MTKQSNSVRRNERRGVGAIVGGVILAAIMVTTVLVYFITILNNEKVKTAYQLDAENANQERAAENLLVLRDTELSTNKISIHVKNEGSQSLVLAKLLTYCLSVGCPDPPAPQGVPVIESLGITLNGGESYSKLVGPVTNGLNYRVDVISERGNVVSSKICTVDLPNVVCSNDANGGSTGPDFELAANPTLLVFEAGQSGTSKITVKSLNGFNSQVTLSVGSTVTGITTAFNSTQVTPPANSNKNATLTFNSAPTTVPGTYVYSIQGTSGVTHSTQISVTILGSTQGAIDTGIIQGTGSLKLDFKAFGAIYPQLASRAGIDQRGWDTKVGSGFSWVPGYPAYDIMLGQNTPQVVFVESARNMDPSGQNMILNRNTGLVTSNDQVQGTPPTSNYICKGDIASKTLLKYNEGANSVTLPNTPVGSSPTAGWQQMFFCSSSPSDGTAGSVPSGNLWTPGTKFSQLNGLFWIARGTFTPVFSEYGQTIPYQGVTYAKAGINSCLRSSSVSTACVNPTTADNTASLRYSATKAEMKAGVTVYAHVQGSGLTAPYNISFLYPDGTYRQLATNQNLNGQGNIQLSLPAQNSNDLDGNTTNDIDSYCSGVPSGQGIFFTITVADSFDSSAYRNVYNMTWRMVC